MAARYGHLVAAVALTLTAAPATAQDFSAGYTFIKAVKDREGAKVESLLAGPGTALVNTRESGSGESGLHIVTRGRDGNWLAFLLGKGARPDIQNRTGDSPLTLAAQIGWAEGAEILLSRRASVDLANSRGETPLILAVQKRDLPMVRLLLARGANPKRSDSVAGYSALDYARQDGRAVAILKLLEAPPAAAPKMQGPTL